MTAPTRVLNEHGHLVAVRPSAAPVSMATTPMATTIEHSVPAQRPLATNSPSSSTPGLMVQGAAALGSAQRWVVRRRWELLPVAATGTLSFLGWAQASAWSTAGFSVAAAAGLGGVYLGLSHKHPKIAEICGVVTLAFGDVATWAGCGASWAALTVSTVLTGVTYWQYGPWLIDRRHARMKLQLDTVKAKGALPDAHGMQAADPGLTGSTSEETAIRKAVYALTGAAPLDVPALDVSASGGLVALVTMPSGRNTSPAQIIAKREQFATNLGLPGRVTLERGPANNQFLVKVSTQDVLAGTIPWTGPSITSIKDAMILGYDEDGVELRQSLYRNHVFIAGASDNGKSGAVNLIVCNLLNCRDVDLYGIDMKAGTPELGVYRPVMKRVASTPEEARALLEELEAEYRRRGAILGGLSAEGIPVRQWDPELHGNAIVVVTDEMNELIEQDPDLAVLYRRLAALVRYVGIVFVSATQTPSAKVFGGDKDGAANYQVQIGLRVISPTQTNVVMGAGLHGQGWRLSDLDAPGKAMVRSRENGHPRVIKLIYTTDADIAGQVGIWHSDIKATVDMPAITDEPWTKLLAVQRYPDGQQVARDEWPQLWREFERRGSATKQELVDLGVVSSRDTVRRALAVWERHGVRHRKDGLARRYYLPAEAELRSA